MFIAYLIYKKSWIGLMGLLLLLTNALILLDMGIRVEPYSLIYLNILFLSICAIFFIIRYKQETSYYQSLVTVATNLDDDWFESILSPHSRFLESTVHTLLQSIHEHEQNKRHEDHFTQQMDNHDLASWVHEMKTPLTAMKITLDAYRSNELAQRLNAPWLRMHLLLDRQLYISRLANLETDLLPEKLEVQALIREEIRELSTWCMEKNISIDLTGSTSSTVYTDKKWCGFMMRQILTNAIKYSSMDGNVIIHIGRDNHEFVVVSIIDEGPGIQTHDLPRLFDKGFTGENGRVQHSATGMGLYIANEVSKKLHIRLKVASDFGKGTSVSMIFANDNPFESMRRTLL